jgi:hypothetical protein
MYGLEELLVKYNVDLEIWAHQHSYERLYPVDNYTVYKKYVIDIDNQTIYYNSPKPVQITSGSPGCNELLTPFKNITYDWTAFRSETYGYGHMYIYNSTHIHINQKNAITKDIVDSFWIVKEKSSLSTSS